MSRYNGWSDVPIRANGGHDAEPGPMKACEQRAEAFRRGMTEVDQAGDMLAELRREHRALVKVLRERIHNFKMRARKAEQERITRDAA